MGFLEKARDVLWKIGKAFAVDLSPEIARGVIADYLRKARVEDLVNYIESNESVFEKIWGSLRDDVKEKIVKTLSNIKEAKDMITVKTTLEALVEAERYDLLAVFVNSKKALQWLRREVELAKKTLWP
ncbi:MAG: hypothetical protein NDF55_10390 [archaeon GB-1867-005]|nr:hypothetical protein [Candidatus Culexmicrobium cathedralense]